MEVATAAADGAGERYDLARLVDLPQADAAGIAHAPPKQAAHTGEQDARFDLVFLGQLPDPAQQVVASVQSFADHSHGATD